jgi:hypothetical protein
MKRVLFLFFVLFSLTCSRTFAIDRSGNLLSLINLSREKATQEKITALLGQPMKIEENKKRIWWHYSKGNTDLVICWNRKSDVFENFSFTCKPGQKCVFDNGIPGKLKSGSTDILQALALLGTPADMKIKGATQEMHYAYQNSVLRLFFRNRVLVDYTLLGTPSR